MEGVFIKFQISFDLPFSLCLPKQFEKISHIFIELSLFFLRGWFAIDIFEFHITGIKDRGSHRLVGIQSKRLANVQRISSHTYPIQVHTISVEVDQEL